MDAPTFSKLALSKDIRKRLLGAAEKLIFAKLNKLIQKNISLSDFTPSDYPAAIFKIIYNEEEYIYQVPVSNFKQNYPDKVIEIPVHRSLAEQFFVVQGEIANLQIESDQLLHYLRTILNKCENLADVYLLFPEPLHELLPPKPNVPPTISRSILRWVQRFQALNEHLIKKRILVNFLRS